MAKPDNTAELIEKEESLEGGFPHVRVNFYRMKNGKLYFGEMTFSSFSGNEFYTWPIIFLSGNA